MATIGTFANGGASAYGWSTGLERIGGMALITPTSIASTGTGNSSSIGSNGSIDFSTCATLAVNGVFSAIYNNYMVIARYSGTGDNQIRIRFRASGTDNTTASSYVSQYIYADGTALFGSRGTLDHGWFAWRGNTQRAGSMGYIYAPYLTQPTAWRTVNADDYLNAITIDVAGTHNQSTSYDGFSLITSAGSFSGVLSVYGLVGA